MRKDNQTECREELKEVLDLINKGEYLGAFNTLQDAQRSLLEVLLIEVERDLEESE